MQLGPQRAARRTSLVVVLLTLLWCVIAPNTAITAGNERPRLADGPRQVPVSVDSQLPLHRLQESAMPTYHFGDQPRENATDGGYDAFPDVGPLATNSVQSYSSGEAAGNYAGLEIGLWGWMLYAGNPPWKSSSFLAYEFELDLTKSFNERMAASVELDFQDWHTGSRVEIEQMFFSILLENDCETILTAGKFNAPFGAEPRDFWYRLTGSRSLLFTALPQDVIGLMLTHPTRHPNFVVRPMVVNGLVESGYDNNDSPSFALMVEYRPDQNLEIGMTSWGAPELTGNNSEWLYFLDAHVNWRPCQSTTILAELLATGA